MRSGKHLIAGTPVGANDRLGFHNPLQRAYATTAFLEALFEGSRDPERLRIVCLDEMRLARAGYYFADCL